MINKKRVIGLALTLAMLATGAFAFYLAEVVFEGNATSNAGKTTAETLPFIKAEFAPGIMPGEGKTLTAELKNTTAHEVTYRRVAATFSTGSAECLPAWFALEGMNENAKHLLKGEGNEKAEGVKVAAGATVSPFGIYDVKFKEEPVDQDACEGVAITAHLKITER
jgi:hypothetical protein